MGERDRYWGVRISSSTRCSSWPPEILTATLTGPSPTGRLEVATLPSILHWCNSIRSQTKPEACYWSWIVRILEMKKPHRISFEDAVAVGGSEVKLIQHRGGIFDVLGGEVVRAHYDAIGPDQAH